MLFTDMGKGRKGGRLRTHMKQPFHKEEETVNLLLGTNKP